MDLGDFETRPAKRQRTMSPEAENNSQAMNNESDFYDTPKQIHVGTLEETMDSCAPIPPSAPEENDEPTQNVQIPGLGLPDTVADLHSHKVASELNEDGGILDALMQHVESESRPADALSTMADSHAMLDESVDGSKISLNQDLAAVASTPSTPLDGGAVLLPPAATGVLSPGHMEQQIILQEQNNTATGDSQRHQETQKVTDELLPNFNEALPQGQTAASASMEGIEVAATASTVAPPPTSDIALPGASGGAAGEGVEWEIDSSPLESSTDSDDSSDTTSSDDSDDADADGDYAMLDPEEQARILMQGDGGSDDEGGKSKDKGDAVPLRTANEKVEEVVPKPDITVTNEMAIEELGKVEGVVEATVLVKAKVSGEYQVLESNSLLCLKDRSVVGVVAETLGRVEQPMYTVRFTNDKAIEDAGLSTKDTVVYYVPQHSTFVFTRPLRAVKGSDASNFHDEEVGDDEMEFSDDEAEAEHKRRLKMKRQGKNIDSAGRAQRGRGNRGGTRGERQFVPASNLGGQNESAYGNGSLEMNYDDMDSVDNGYTPLARPTSYQAIMVSGQAGEARSIDSLQRDRGGPGGRGRVNDRGRGDRARGNRGGRNRGGRETNSSNGIDRRQSSENDIGIPLFTQSSPPASFIPNQMPSPSQYSLQQPYQQAPHHPVLSAQASTYPPSPFSPSPISPLPRQQYNFGNFGNQPPQQQYGNGYPNHHQPQQQWPSQNTPQQHLPRPMPLPGSHVNPAFIHNSVYQQHQQHSAWTANQAAAAEVQRQLEQMRRAGGGQ